MGGYRKWDRWSEEQNQLEILKVLKGQVCWFPVWWEPNLVFSSPSEYLTDDKIVIYQTTNLPMQEYQAGVKTDGHGNPIIDAPSLLHMCCTCNTHTRKAELQSYYSHYIFWSPTCKFPWSNGMFLQLWEIHKSKLISVHNQFTSYVTAF